MNPGTKTKPTALKLLEGNPGKRPLNQTIMKQESIIPACPIWLEDEAKAEWNRITPELHNLRLLTKIDVTALVGYCQSWARYVEAEQYLSKNDTVFVTETGYMQQVPQVGMAQKYLKLCQSFMTEFGLTPSSRAKLSIPGENVDDDMEKFLSVSK
jgi:P27 family predicted phage terminase small subunit